MKNTNVLNSFYHVSINFANKYIKTNLRHCKI